MEGGERNREGGSKERQIIIHVSCDKYSLHTYSATPMTV